MCTPWLTSPHFLHLCPLATTILLSKSVTTRIPHTSDVMQCLSFSDWLISLSSFIYVVTNDKISSCFMAELNNTPLYIYTTFSLSIHQWTLGWFPYPCYTECGVQVSLWDTDVIFWDLHTEARFLGYMVVPFFIFWGKHPSCFSQWYTNLCSYQQCARNS